MNEVTGLIGVALGALTAIGTVFVIWGQVRAKLEHVTADLQKVQATLQPIAEKITKVDTLEKSLDKLEVRVSDESKRLHDRVETVAARTHEHGNELQRLIGRGEMEEARRRQAEASRAG